MKNHRKTLINCHEYIGHARVSLIVIYGFHWSKYIFLSSEFWSISKFCNLFFFCFTFCVSKIFFFPFSPSNVRKLCFIKQTDSMIQNRIKQQADQLMLANHTHFHWKIPCILYTIKHQIIARTAIQKSFMHHQYQLNVRTDTNLYFFQSFFKWIRFIYFQKLLKIDSCHVNLLIIL